jgi:cytidine deaminase
MPSFLSIQNFCMSEKIETTTVKEYLERDELDDEQRSDLAAATLARQSAHRPYSTFLVGAAIRTYDGEVYSGWNVENIVYKGTHAEVNTVGRLTPQSREAGIKRLTVVGGPAGNENFDVPCRPCGDCRQFCLEFLKEGDNPEVISAAIKGRVLKTFLRDDLPDAFFPDILRKK